MDQEQQRIDREKAKFAILSEASDKIRQLYKEAQERTYPAIAFESFCLQVETVLHNAITRIEAL